MLRLNIRKCITLMLLVVGVKAYGQQKPQYTQYMINPFVMNPAVSGTEDYIDLRAGYRNQWVGFPGAPKTFYLSGHAPIGKRLVTHNRSRNKKNGFHGVGGYVSNDVTGPTSRLTFNGAYSYHMKFGKDLFGSLGIMGGLQQYTLDASKLVTANPGDQAIVSYNHIGLADINAGFWLYSKNFYAGGSMVQVMQQKIFNNFTNTVDQGKLTHHYFVTGGYRIPFAWDFTFIPSFMIKYANPAPVSFDLNAKVKYKNLFWGGMSYRHKDAVAILAGVIINEMFDVSYSYDFTTSDIRKYSGGTHEIVIGYRLKMSPGLKCPSHFW